MHHKDTRETATALKSVHASRLSTDDAFINPPMTLTSLKIAREELNKAIAVMERTKWTR